MEKIKVEYLGGESRFSNRAANFMLVNAEIDGEEVEIYAEYVYPDISEEEKEDYDYIAHEWDGFDECKADFLEEARQYGLSEDDFDFVDWRS